MYATSSGRMLTAGVALLLSACSSSGGGNEEPSLDSTPREVASAGGDTKAPEDMRLQETATTACLGLSLEECQVTEHCVPLAGAPLQEGCTWGESEYAGCWTGQAIEDGELVGFSCETIPAYAHPPDQPDGWYVFPEFCVPDGWVSSEEPPCTVEPEPDVEEGEEDSCHLDCFGGLKCSGGVMQAAVSEPLPCSEDSCFKGGPKWPCLSGVCGEFELCSDDEAYLIGLVPADSLWKEGKRVLDQGLFERFDGINYYTTSVTLVDEDDHDVLKADLSPFPSGEENKIAGTTHLQAAPLGVENIHVLEISGTPVVADGGTRIFSPLLEFMDGHDNHGHEQGIGGALLIQHSDGAQTTVVWRATNDWEKVLFAIHTE